MAGPGVSPFLFGRERERSLVESCLRDGESCVLVGEAGIGKTALARAVAAGFEPAPAGGGLSTLAHVPYVPLRLALGRPVAPGDDAHVADEVAEAVGGGLLVLDDLQWADAATRRVLELLAGRIRLLAAVRLDDPAAEDALALCDRVGLRRVPVAPLADDASHELLAALRQDLARPAAVRLVERAAGNPLFLRELAETGEPSQSFALALAARLARLPGAAREALGLLALLGRPAPPGYLDAGALAELRRRGLVDEHAGRVAVRHPLYAEAALDGLDAETSRRLHARLAGLVEDRGEAARHLAAAGEHQRAGELALEAVEDAGSPAERAALLAVAAASAEGERQVDLSVEAARELVRSGDHTEAETMLDRLPPLAGRDVARAACVRWATRYELGDLAGAQEQVRRGLAAAAGDAELLTELRLAEVSLTLLDERSSARERLRKAGAAWRLARRTGVRVARAAYLHGTALYLAHEPEWVTQLEWAVEEARRSGDVESELSAGYNTIAAHESFCRPDRGREVAEQMARRARELRAVAWERQFRSTIVNLDLHLGRYGDVVREGNALIAEGLDPRRRDVVEIDVSLALVDLGRFDEAAPRIERLLAAGAADVRGQGLGRWLRAEAELWGGRARAALEWIEPFLARDDLGVFEAFGRTVEAWARLDLGLPVAAWQADDLPPILDGTPRELSGLARLAAGEPAAAAELLREASSAFAGAHLRGELRCLLGAGIALSAMGEADEARSVLLAVEERAEAHEMAPLLGRARRSLRLLGVRRSAPRARRADGLTAREAEVLGLAAAGLTNAAIARRLGIGSSTVKRLVASGSRKLGAGTRAQAVSLFAGR